jgi:DeoR/GlpR family transcriptional regulator of sugar metabolism
MHGIARFMTIDPPMERRDIIAGRLAQGQSVTAGGLAEEFSVSPDAVRRDLRALAAEGRCRRVYGGALPISPAASPIIVRVGEARERKAALAAAAVGLIRPSEFVFLDNGSTNLALARILAERLPSLELTVATNSVAIAAMLADRRDLRLHLVGGLVDPEIGGSVDATAVLAIQHINVDRCFLGACSASVVEGVSAFDAADAAFKRVLLTRSRRIVMMVTNDKLGTSAPHRVTPLDHIDSLVVEHDAAAHAEFASIMRLGVDIVTSKSPA